MNLTGNIYRDMAARTGGNIYVGVVGPVRTGKSTFIKRFMETLVIPRMDDIYMRERAKDELPQSGSGRSIMTAEPKFVPEDAARIELESGGSCAVRLVDCVGYMVPGAVGLLEDGSERMVMTPWYDHEIPMTQAAEEGTRRVISEHSSIVILVTTDGSLCDIVRSDYIEAEKRVVQELKRLGKPFVILLNCAKPDSEEAKALARELSEEYAAVCMAVSCMDLDEKDILYILEKALYEFPAEKLLIYFPHWFYALGSGHELVKRVYASLGSACEGLCCLRDLKETLKQLNDCEFVQEARLDELPLDTGVAKISLTVPQELYYQTISAESGFDIANDGDLMELLRSLSKLKGEYDRVHQALEDVREHGYGVVLPSAEELSLEEPEIVRQGGRYGVRLKASAPSIHMMMANIETEVSPALGGEKASEEILGFLLQGFQGDVGKIWESNIFGKSLYDIAGESVYSKIHSLPPETQKKLQQTLERIINEGSGRLICILL